MATPVLLVEPFLGNNLTYMYMEHAAVLQACKLNFALTPQNEHLSRKHRETRSYLSRFLNVEPQTTPLSD